MHLAEKLVRIREERGWTAGYAASQTLGVHRFTLAKLETGATQPAKASAATMIDLIKLYYPDLELADFVGIEMAAGLTLKRRGRPPKEPLDGRRTDHNPAHS